MKTKESSRIPLKDEQAGASPVMGARLRALRGETADTLVLGTSAERRAGATPAAGTNLIGIIVQPGHRALLAEIKVKALVIHPISRGRE